MGVLGELAVCGNEIVDCGIGIDGKPNPAATFGILGMLVLEALVSENLVTTTLADARPDGLEDRALAMMGQWEFSTGENELTVGFPCTITGNKFYGKGFSALVQLAEAGEGNVRVRFERVFFTNNYCNHFGARAPRGATVSLVGTAAVVMGNQVKGISRDAPSIDMNGMAGTVVGNITTGPIANHPNFPAQEHEFNRRL